MDKIKKLWRDRKQQTQYAKWLARYTKPYSGKIFLVMLINLCVSLIGVGNAVISKKLIDSATLSNVLISLIAVYTILLMVNIILDVVKSLVSVMLNEKFSFGIRKQIYDKIIRSKWMEISKYHTGDLMTRLTSDAGAIADGIINTIPEIIGLLVELIVVFITLFIYSKILAVFALLLAPISVILCFFLGRKLKRLQVKVQESESKYRSFLQESLANVLIIKAFNNEKHSLDRLVELRDNRFYWVFRRSKLGVITSNVMSLTFNIGYIVAFTYGAFLIANHSITYGTMTIFLTLVNRVQAPILQLASEIPKIISIFASAGRIIELQNIPLEERDEREITSREIGVKAENLTFGYTKELVLDDTSLEIQPSEFVAVVGESGIGKTTLVRLMMSFVESNEGKIQYLAKDGSSERVNATNREFISYVPQGNTLFSGTIRENILTGKLDASEKEIKEALIMSCSADFISDLPEGIDTVIGERGHGLSEGQAQRIAIARALIKKAPLLILDEATSALDENTELAVLQHIRSIKPRPTCILITHRRSVLAYCDRELVIENKQIQMYQNERLKKVGS